MITKTYKNEDYFIISIRFTASEYYMKKHFNQEQIGTIKFYEAIDKYHKFYCKFIEKVTGKDMEWFHEHFIYGAMDCSKEYLLAEYGIRICEETNSRVFLIPRKLDISKWILENLKDIKHKILKRSNYLRPQIMKPSIIYRELFKTKHDTK